LLGDLFHQLHCFGSIWTFEGGDVLDLIRVNLRYIGRHCIELDTAIVGKFRGFTGITMRADCTYNKLYLHVAELYRAMRVLPEWHLNLEHFYQLFDRRK
jgi:hypothetical protein